MDTTFQPTDEQINACERHTDSKGKPYYTVQSSTDTETKYTVRWREGYFWPRCNCRDGGIKCWHAATAMALEAIEKDAEASEARTAQIREQRAVKRDGLLAYSRKPFDLLAS